jgi:carbonic anhydrase
VALREANSKQSEVSPPTYDNPGFRALVEENAKRSATLIYQDSVMINQYTRLLEHNAESSGKDQAVHVKRGEAVVVPVFIHTWVYGERNILARCNAKDSRFDLDLETGHITDLDHSFGPPGYTIPTLAGAYKQSSVVA